MKRVIFTEKAPKPVGPYSQGILAGGFLFVAGQIPIDPESGEIIRGDFEKETRRVLENIKAIVEAAGGSLEDVVKVTVYLKDVGKFPEFNKIYGEYFKENPPARVVVEVSELPKGVDMMVDAIAYIEGRRYDESEHRRYLSPVLGGIRSSEEVRPFYSVREECHVLQDV